MADFGDSDSLNCMLETLTLAEKERQAFFKQLDGFPHIFQMQDQHRLTESHYKKVKACLESALSVGYKTNLENARARNVLAFANYQLGRAEEALQELNKVLEMEDQSNNLVTLANKAIILQKESHLSRADELLERLRQIKKDSSREEFAFLVARGKGEIAFAYTRLGTPFGSLAIKVFEEIIPAAKYKDSAKWLWMFGLALTKRRMLRDLPYAGFPPEGERLELHREVLRLYLNILEHVVCPTFRARIYSEIALVLYSVFKSRAAYAEFQEISGLTTEEACEIALRLDDNDNSVLCKCGRMYRYLGRHEKSRELLEKALSIRPSSTSYHHLGITYKLLATDNKYRPKPKSKAGSRLSYKELAETYGNKANTGKGEKQTALSMSRPLSPIKEVRSMQLAVKSPPKGVTTFTRQDKYVAEAIKNLEQAVVFGEGLNIRAVMDLAIMQRSLGELQEAHVNLKKLLKGKPPTCASDHVTIYDQLGCVLNELAEEEKDDDKKRELQKDSNDMYLIALKQASQLLGQVPEIRDHIGDIWRSFNALLQDAEKSRSPHEKLQKKAQLFQLIRNHKQSIDLLQEIKKMDPMKANDPQYLKMYIENYVDMKQYEKALAFVELLGLISQRERVMQLFGDPHFLSKVYVEAAREALLQGSVKARVHFGTVFRDIVAVHSDATSGSEDTSDTASEVSGKCNDDVEWDVMILHEDKEASRDKAVALANVLHDACGLRVPILDRDQPINRLDLEGKLRMMRRSAMLVVLAGDRKVSRDMRYLIHTAINRLSTVTLLAEGSHVPEMLRKAHRFMICAPGLFQISINQELTQASMTQADVDAVCDVFRFLLNISPITK